jgi:hypothetical protein
MKYGLENDFATESQSLILQSEWLPTRQHCSMFSMRRLPKKFNRSLSRLARSISSVNHAMILGLHHPL